MGSTASVSTDRPISSSYLLRMPRRPDQLFGSAGGSSGKVRWPPLCHRMLPTYVTRRPQAVNRGLNDLVGLRNHGLPAGRCSRAAARAAGLSSLKSSLLLCSLQPQCCCGTDGLDCGRELHKLDARGTLWACSRHRRAVYESRAGAHSRGSWRFRIAPQLIALSRTIDRVARVGSAVASASVCGAIPACRDHICVTSRVALCRAGAGRRTSGVV